MGLPCLVEDYASPPQTRPVFDRTNPPPNDFEGLPYQLARMNLLASEPPDAPLSASRLFVIDQNGALYVLDKKNQGVHSVYRLQDGLR